MEMKASAGIVFDKMAKNSEINKLFGASFQEVHDKIDRNEKLDDNDKSTLSIESNKEKIDAGEKTIVDIHVAAQKDKAFKAQMKSFEPKRSAASGAAESKNYNQTANVDHERGR